LNFRFPLPNLRIKILILFWWILKMKESWSWNDMVWSFWNRWRRRLRLRWMGVICC
jgi:hypothetical protein